MDTNKHTSSSINAFLALIRAGLWADAGFSELWKYEYADPTDWGDIFQLADEQSVVGLALAGIDWFKVHDSQFLVPQELLLKRIGEIQLLEQKNKAMNIFISELVEKMRAVDIYTLLVKGQGVAQCYERPLWRCCGDIDLFLNDDNYNRSKKLLVPISSKVEKEYVREKHLGMTIDGFVVELHGTLCCGLSSRIEKGLDEIKKVVFFEGKVRSWMNDRTQVFLLNADEDVIYVFTHMLQHFYKEGLGLRQICDWCRLLYRYHDKLDLRLLEQRIKRMGLMSEWKAFGAFAVEYLGMPVKAMPFYSVGTKWMKKAGKICDFVMEVGNMGHNRDTCSFCKYPYIIRKVISFGRRCSDMWWHARLFPLDSLFFFPYMIFNGLRSTLRGEG